MNVLGICGYSDSGKTTLVERLVPAFDRLGQVATIKSIHHDIEVDTPGTDTHRHASAGADSVVGITPSRTFEVSKRGKKRADTDGETDALGEQLRLFRRRGYDVVLVEGFRQASMPKIVVGECVPEGTAPDVIAHVSQPSDLEINALVTTFETKTDASGSRPNVSDPSPGRDRSLTEPRAVQPTDNGGAHESGR
jgi:molybdopterin-guanine dinucleotide biosynthesis adapter protein